MIKTIRYTLFAVSIPMMLAGYLFLNFTLMLAAALLLWSANMVFSFENIRERIIFALFHGTIFLFLLSRPMVLAFKGWPWAGFSNGAMQFSLLSIYASMLFLYFGAQLAHWMQNKHPLKPKPKLQTREYKEFLHLLQLFSMALLYVALSCHLVMEFEKLVFMRGREYVDYYVLFETGLPLIVRVFGGMMKASMGMFLVTRPSKHKTFIPFCLYLISTVPMLLIGQRNPAVLAAIFIFLYYFIRDVIDNSHPKWLGLGEKTFILAGTPFAVIFLSLYNNIRIGRSISNTSIGESLFEFFYHQGISFESVAIAYETFPKLPGGFKSYTFGPIIDYFTTSYFASVVFGTQYIGAGASVEKALGANRLADTITYLAQPARYLKGGALGSSYILETYVDFGWVGMLVFSLLLGALMLYMIPMIRRNWFLGTVVLVGLTNFFFIARGEALMWLTNLLTPHFWVAIAFCYFGAKLCGKKYSLSGALHNPSWTKPLY